MYGLLIATGVIVSLFYAEFLAEKKSLSKETFWKLAFWGLLAGIIGARLYHVVHLWDFYSQNPAYIFAIWTGGLGIYGGVFFAGLVIWNITRDKIFDWLDVFAQVLPLGQAIGRWGNYFNRELLPFAIYESILDIVLFVCLNLLAKKKLRKGTLFVSYVIGYAAIRLFLEKYRTEHWMIANYNVTSIVSLVIILVAGILLWKINKQTNY